MVQHQCLTTNAPSKKWLADFFVHLFLLTVGWILGYFFSQPLTLSSPVLDLRIGPVVTAATVLNFSLYMERGRSNGKSY